MNGGRADHDTATPLSRSEPACSSNRGEPPNAHLSVTAGLSLLPTEALRPTAHLLVPPPPREPGPGPASGTFFV